MCISICVTGCVLEKPHIKKQAQQLCLWGCWRRLRIAAEGSWLLYVFFCVCALILLADANDLFHKRKTKGQEDDPRVNIGMSDFKSHPNSSLKMIRHRIHYFFFLTLTKPVCTKQQPHEVMDKPTTLKLSIFMSLTGFLKGQVTA